jgi:hypothetical protein
MPTPFAPGSRPLGQIFLLGLMVFAIMFVGAAALYGVTEGLLRVNDYVVHQVVARQGR